MSLIFAMIWISTPQFYPNNLYGLFKQFIRIALAFKAVFNEMCLTITMKREGGIYG